MGGASLSVVETTGRPRGVTEMHRHLKLAEPSFYLYGEAGARAGAAEAAAAAAAQQQATQRRRCRAERGRARAQGTVKVPVVALSASCVYIQLCHRVSIILTEIWATGWLSLTHILYNDRVSL